MPLAIGARTRGIFAPFQVGAQSFGKAFGARLP
jgi:hypothetical protein